MFLSMTHVFHRLTDCSKRLFQITLPNGGLREPLSTGTDGHRVFAQPNMQSCIQQHALPAGLIPTPPKTAYSLQGSGC